MKRIAFVIGAMALWPLFSLSAQITAVPVVKTPEQAMYTSIDAYGQASYFHEVVKERRCDKLDANTVHAIDQRFEAARAQLTLRYGDMFSRIDKPVTVLNPNAECDRMTLDSYARHVTAVEQLLQESAALH